MDNPLQKYMGKELKDVIASLTTVQGTSKDGAIYYCVEIAFINGYKKRVFLKSDEAFAWCNAFDLLETNKQVIDNF